jgi:hypothetical protein
MRVSKSSSRKPGYPSKRQFLAALGVGVMAAASQAEPPKLGGVPLPPKAAVEKEIEPARLLGDIAVVPKGTNAVTVPPAATNAVPRLPGKPASPK